MVKALEEHGIQVPEKDSLTGNVNYDPDNHQLMVETRAAKVEGIRESIPTPKLNGPDTGDLLVVAWGSPYGAVRAAVERLQKEGAAIAHLHMRHLWPLPKGLPEIFAGFKRIIIPELNMGQLARLLYQGRAACP